ncbi:MAG TPA: class F sortase [Pseudonocardiaceae bacterium]
MLLLCGATLVMMATATAASPTTDTTDSPPVVQVVNSPIKPGVSPSGTTPAASSSSSPTPTTATTPAALPRSVPVSISIPAIGVKSSLVPLGLTAAGQIQVPPLSQVMQAGWYKNGPTPGENGPAVILGHVDSYRSAGVFYRLRDMKPGDLVFVARQDGSTAKFQVTGVDLASKNAFPTSAVYGNTTDPQLRLITCGGSFDWTELSYRDNVIVYARLVD